MTTPVWRPIDAKLLGAALTAAFGLNVLSTPPGDQDVAESLIRDIVAHLEEADLFCDHSVGICSCGDLATLAELRLWLDHKRTCPECGGEGARYVGYDAEHDTEMYEPCPTFVEIIDS